MKINLKKTTFAAAALLASVAGSVVVPHAAEAAPRTQVTASPLAGHSLELRYCWSTTTFRSACPKATLPLTANGTVNNMPGSSWTETPTTVTLDFLNPSTVVPHVVYAGTSTGSTTQICYTGTMTATRNILPNTMTGVWQGCIV